MKSTFVIILQIGRQFIFMAIPEQQGGGGDLEFCWQKGWGATDGLESYLAGKATSSCGWTGCRRWGNNRHHG